MIIDDDFDELMDEEQRYEEEILNQQLEEKIEEDASASISHFPEINYYLKTYANSLEGNDQKGSKVFFQYESQERVRRLQRELIQIKEGKGSKRVCNDILGKKRENKHTSYENLSLIHI